MFCFLNKTRGYALNKKRVKFLLFAPNPKGSKRNLTQNGA